MRRQIGWWLPGLFWRVVARVDEADQVPDRIPNRGIVLVGANAGFKWAAFDCACGRDRILLNLQRVRRPVWAVTTSLLLGATIHPSVDTLHGGTRCHYIIRGGRTLWVHDREGNL